MNLLTKVLLSCVVTATGTFGLQINNEQPVQYIDVQPFLIEPTTTTTTSIPFAEQLSHVKRCPHFEQMFKAYGLEPVAVFSKIAYRESRCNPSAVNAKWDANGNIVWTLNKNGSYDSGLLQINSSWKTVTRKICGGDIKLLMQVDCNLRVAKYLLDNGGLNHWSMSL
jgi:hypothetical protein